ncbi:MAG: DNA polymerase III subunit delta [Taibaiella sp.]|nr:DNA polymerase III subunit delta [Taibaiella sp.]
MNAEYLKIIQALKTRQFAPVYVIDGEEAYYIDRLTEIFENNIVTPAERDFNLITLYGKDVQWADVINACRRFPMFAEKQVVILKDAAQLSGLPELINYFEKPMPTTVLLIEHRFKKIDGKTKFGKAAKEKTVYYTSEKIKDEKMPGWIRDYGKSIGFQVGEKVSEVLTSYLGNDLQKIVNEIEKVRINIPNEKELTEDHIKKYIGVSRDYNIFDLPVVLTGGDREKFYKMLSYFLSTPKASPMVLMVTSFYGHFSKLYMANFLIGKPEKDISAALGAWKSREYMAATGQWPLPRVERALLILAKYSTMAVGIESSADDRELLKEMMGQLLM